MLGKGRSAGRSGRSSGRSSHSYKRNCPNSNNYMTNLYVKQYYAPWNYNFYSYSGNLTCPRGNTTGSYTTYSSFNPSIQLYFPNNACCGDEFYISETWVTVISIVFGIIIMGIWTGCKYLRKLK